MGPRDPGSRVVNLSRKVFRVEPLAFRAIINGILEISVLDNGWGEIRQVLFAPDLSSRLDSIDNIGTQTCALFSRVRSIRFFFFVNGVK